MQVVKYPHHLLIPVWGKYSAPCRIHLPSAGIGILNNYSFFRRLSHQAWKDNRQCLNFPCLSHSHYESSFYFSMITNSEQHLFYFSHIRDDLAQSYIQCDAESNGIKLHFKVFPSQKPVLYIFPFFAKCTVVLDLNSYTFSLSHIWTQNNTCLKSHQRDCLRNKIQTFTTVKS